MVWDYFQALPFRFSLFAHFPRIISCDIMKLIHFLRLVDYCCCRTKGGWNRGTNPQDWGASFIYIIWSLYKYLCRALNLSLYTSTSFFALGGAFLLDIRSCFCAHIIKYWVLVLLQELVEECDNLDKTVLSRLTTGTGRGEVIQWYNFGENEGHLYVIHVHILVCVLTIVVLIFCSSYHPPTPLT